MYKKEVVTFIFGLVIGLAGMAFLLKKEKQPLEKAGNNIRVIKTWVEQPYNVKCYYLVVDNDTVVGVKQYND